MLISHCVVRVLLLQLLSHVGDGGDGRLQVRRKDQAEAVGVREPMELHCTLTPERQSRVVGDVCAGGFAVISVCLLGVSFRKM